ncbi:EB domain-containing protein [Aphelenchoides besseyi]|nr:EB domain-containing protein [Aphelenchoides besseyi]
MATRFVFLVSILALLIRLADAQFYGSNFLSALRGYGGDMCRFISCPVGQTCVNGVCNGGGLVGGYYSGLNGGFASGAGLGLLGGANKLCAETVDCYSGQICQAGRCTFTSALGGFAGGALGGGLMSPMLEAGPSVYHSGALPPPLPNGMVGVPGNPPSGFQPCSLMQDCLNGQICVNGYCSQSNVVYGGSQAMRSLTSCATGAVCPVAHVCLAGTCVPNYFSKTTACITSSTCQFGQICQVGRCLPNAFYGPNSGHVLPKPVECPDGTTECYKYECGGEIPFTTRGCGLSFETQNLWNDSCGQARSICETLNQRGTCLICDHKHMCNGGSSSHYFLTIIYATCNLLYLSL